MKNFFEEADTLKWENINRQAEDEPGEDLLNVVYASDSVRRVKMPGKLFTKIIKERRPEYMHLLPYGIKITPLNESKENLKNPYIKKDMILGINEGDYLTFHIGSEYKPTVKEVMWMLLHEFRHKIQYNVSSVRSCIYNENLEKAYDALPYTEDSVNHVFHELLPYEVDANIFAFELMGLDYNVRKWAIHLDRLKQKEKK